VYWVSQQCHTQYGLQRRRDGHGRQRRRQEQRGERRTGTHDRAASRVQVDPGEHDGGTDAVPVSDRVDPGAVGQPEPEHPEGVPGRPEPERGRVHQAGEQGPELDRVHRQRDRGAKAGRQHAHLADDRAEHRARLVRAVPGLVERPEPAAAAVHAVAHLRRDGQERGSVGVRLLFRPDPDGRDGAVASAAGGRHRILDGHVHGRVLVHRRHKHGKHTNNVYIYIYIY